MDEIDIWKAADKMIFVYGEDADLHAAMQVESANTRGDNEDKNLWNRVAQAILELSRCKRYAGGALH